VKELLETVIFQGHNFGGVHRHLPAFFAMWVGEGVFWRHPKPLSQRPRENYQGLDALITPARRDQLNNYCMGDVASVASLATNQIVLINMLAHTPKTFLPHQRLSLVFRLGRYNSFISCGKRRVQPLWSCAMRAFNRNTRMNRRKTIQGLRHGSFSNEGIYNSHVPKRDARFESPQISDMCNHLSCDS
jgi:hypothetical protein